MFDLRPWKKPLACLLLAIVCVAATSLLMRLGFFQTLELRTLDYRFRYLGAAARRPRPDIVLIEIDDFSIKSLEPAFGRWPWPRDAHAALVDFLSRAPARLIVFDVGFWEPDVTRPEADEELARATRDAGNVIHAAFLGLQDLGYADKVSFGGNSLPGCLPGLTRFTGYIRPIPGLGANALGVGHVAMTLDPDGPWRRSLPLACFHDRMYPSLPLAAALAAQKLRTSDVRVEGDTLVAGSVRAPLDANGRLPIWFNGPPGSYRSYSYAHLFYSELQISEGTKPGIDPAEFRDRIVIIGTSAAALHDIFTTPFSGAASDSAKGGGLGKMMGAEVHANILDNLLSNRYLRPVPRALSWLLVTLASLGLLAAILYLRVFVSVGISLITFPLYLGFAQWVFRDSIQVPVVPFVLGALLSMICGFGYQYWIEGAEKRRIKQMFSRYVSKDVYNELLSNPKAAELGGTRRVATVLFSDLRGFTTLSESRPPEEMIAQLNEYFSEMVEIVFAYRGTVDKFVGDMIMAIFSAPLPDPLHADRAVGCAIAMQRRLVSLNQAWKAVGKPELHCGVGINSGDMVVGNVGSQSIRSYTVIGDNVNLGARLESLCKEYKTDIIISQNTYGLLHETYAFTELGEVTVKGKVQSVRILSVDWKQEAGAPVETA